MPSIGFVALCLIVIFAFVCQGFENQNRQTNGNAATTEQLKPNASASWSLAGNLDCLGAPLRSASVNFLSCYPQTTCYSNYLITTGYGFQISSSANILNVTVTIQRTVSPPYDAFLSDHASLIISSSEIPLTSYANWDANGVFSSGIVSSFYYQKGTVFLTATDVNSNTFGLKYSVVGYATNENYFPTDATIYCISISVTYSLGSETLTTASSNAVTTFNDNIATSTTYDVTTQMPNVNVTTGQESPEATPDYRFYYMVGGAAGGALLLIILVAAAIACVVRRQRRRNSDVEISLANYRGSSASSVRTIEQVPELSDIDVGDIIGSGNYGEVYKGIWNHSTPVALKCLREQVNTKEFERELLALANIGNHPNVVQFLGTFTQRNIKYMVLEYCRGSLKDYLNAEKDIILPAQLLEIANGVCSGMAYLEKRKIVHRDLSARNCLVAEVDGRIVVKVSDFGLSRSIEQLYYKASSSAPIPVRWTAPEALKRGNFTSASDVWSFGVVCWEIYSNGTLPYDWLSNKEVSEQIETGLRLSKPGSCPDDVWIIVLSCWSLDETQRPTFFQLCEQIQSIYQGLSPGYQSAMVVPPLTISQKKVYYN